MDNRETVARNILLNKEKNFNGVQFYVLSKVMFSSKQPLECTKNTFRKYIVFQDETNRFLSVRGHGGIGLLAFPYNMMTKTYDSLESFESENIKGDIERRFFYRLKVKYLNAKHLIFGQPESQLPGAVGRLFMYLLNEYMPIGILDIKQIDKAEDILNTLWQQLTADEEVNIKSTVEFYEMIPQSGPRKYLQLINNPAMHSNKIEVISRLRSALESIYAGLHRNLNPIDYFARNWLRTQLDEIGQNTEEFQNIKLCVTQTQHPNERNFKLTNVFKVSSGADIEFTKDMPNQRLLYHFTFPCNILGILREGLLMAPRHIHSENRFYGDGIYFWDCASMALSAHQKRHIRRAVLPVCRVALGDEQRVEQKYLSKGQVLSLENGKNSIFSRGEMFGNVTNAYVDFNGVRMYKGCVGPNVGRHNFDFYNKYVIQQENQVKVEYILEFERI